VLNNLLLALISFKYIFSFNELSRLPNSEVMFYCHDANRGFSYSNKKYAQLIDTINELLINKGYKTITIATPISVINKNNGFGDIYLVNGIIVRSRFVHKFYQLINILFSLKLNSKIQCWVKILKKVNPKVIVGIEPSVELCIAANIMDIWVADLQHGVISDDGYYSIKYRVKYNQKGWPSCIFCWDKATEIYIKKNLQQYVEVFETGNPWLDRFRFPDSQDTLVQSFLHNENDIDNHKKIILITLQWGDLISKFGKTGIPPELIQIIKDLSPEYSWWIRLHPLYLNSSKHNEITQNLALEFSNNSNICWEKPTELPIPVVLSKSNLHITISSAVTKEAALFHVKTALLSPDINSLNKWFSYELSSGFAEIIDLKKDELKEWILNNIDINSDKPITSNSNRSLMSNILFKKLNNEN